MKWSGSGIKFVSHIAHVPEKNLTAKVMTMEKKGISASLEAQPQICHQQEVPNCEGNYPFTQ